MAVAAARLPGPPPLQRRSSNSSSSSRTSTGRDVRRIVNSVDGHSSSDDVNNSASGGGVASKAYANALGGDVPRSSAIPMGSTSSSSVLINPIAAYSQQLADKQLHIARVNSEGVVHWRRKELPSDCSIDYSAGGVEAGPSGSSRRLPGKDFFKDGLLSRLKVSSNTALEGGMLDTELSKEEREQIEQQLANGHVSIPATASSYHDNAPSSGHGQSQHHQQQQSKDQVIATNKPNGNSNIAAHQLAPTISRPSLSSSSRSSSDTNTFSSNTPSTYGTPLAQVSTPSAFVVDDNPPQPGVAPTIPRLSDESTRRIADSDTRNTLISNTNGSTAAQLDAESAPQAEVTQTAQSADPPLLFVKTSPTLSRQQHDKKVPPPLSSLQQVPQAHIIPPTPPTASTSSSFTPQASTSTPTSSPPKATAAVESQTGQPILKGTTPDSPRQIYNLHLQNQQPRAATDPTAANTAVPRSPVTPSTSSANKTSYLSPDSIKRSPPSHRRSQSYQSTPLNPRASTSTTGSAISPSSQSTAPNNSNVPLATAPLPLPTPSSSDSFPTRRSSLLPPLTTSNALSMGADVASLRKLSLSPRRALSFRGGGAGTTLPGHGPIYDEPMSLEEQAEQQRQADQLDETIARQADQMRKERLSKRIESQRAHDKALAALREEVETRKERGEDTGASALVQGSPPGRSDPLSTAAVRNKERERGDTSSTTGTHSQHQQQQQPSPASPASVHKQLWAASPVAGEKAVLRATSPAEMAAAQNLPLKEKQEVQNEPERVLVGNLIGEDHVNYVLMYNMLTGIRIGVSRCEAKIQRPLTDEDYKAQHKFSFDIVGNELTPSARYDFKFKDYAPWVFRELRAHFHLDPADYLLSLTSKYILSELGSPGKSGSFFYFSRDYRFIIKTISHTEHKFLRRILKEYHTHVLENPNTLISRFYGLHRVKLPHGRKIHFVIMNNLFPPHRDIHETFDLKGSSIGREYPEEKAAVKPRATLKDLNWIHRHREIHFGPTKRKLFEEQLKQDVALLQRLKIMDYSLLIGIHDMGRGNSENLRDGMLTVFQPEGGQGGKLRRRPTHRGDLERDYNAAELRKAVQRADPQVISETHHQLAYKEQAERRQFFFYHDEGGVRATDDNDHNELRIYYLGVIDILTPYNWKKKIEHFWRSMQYDKHRISAVPPKEYGDRFLGFLISAIRGGDQSKRPKME